MAVGFSAGELRELTEDELTEVFLHLSGYIGVPMIREAMMAASKIFAEYRAEVAAEKSTTA